MHPASVIRVGRLLGGVFLILVCVFASFQEQARAGVVMAGRVKGTITSVDTLLGSVAIQPATGGVVVFVSPTTKISIDGKPNQTIYDLQAALNAAASVGKVLEATSIFNAQNQAAKTITARTKSGF